MQLLRKRTFGDYFNDTFGFIKQNGKHFFKNYFILSIIPIALIIIIAFAFSTSLYRLSSYRVDFDNVFQGYFENNIGLMIILGIITFIIFIVFSIIQYTYTPVYFILHEQKGEDFTYKDILRSIFKEKIGKIIIYILFSLLLFIPVSIVMGISFVVLIFTIVGIFIPISAMALWYSMALFAYLRNDISVWDGFKYAWKLMFQKFWKNVGAVAIFMLTILFLQFGLNMILSLFTNFASIGTLYADSGNYITIIILIGTTILMQLVSIFLQLFSQIMIGIIFYSQVEEKENTSSLEEIEQIGLNAM